MRHREDAVDSAQCQHCGDRKIQSTANHSESLAHRNDHQGRKLTTQIEKILDREEARLEQTGYDTEQQDQRGKDQRGPVEGADARERSRYRDLCRIGRRQLPITTAGVSAPSRDFAFAVCPIIASRIAASPPGYGGSNVALIFPPRNTCTLPQSESVSRMSLDTSNTPTPRSASETICRWICARACTSIPAVGSSRITNRTPPRRILPNRIFC